MRMCGHAHHDDMLYLGKDPQPSWTYPPLAESGYADRERYEFWCRKDPIATYAAKLEAEGDHRRRRSRDVPARGGGSSSKRKRAPSSTRRGPMRELAGIGVVADEPRRVHIEVLDEEWRHRASENIALPPVEDAPPFDAKGKTFLEAVMLGVGDALRADPRTFVYGEDVGGKYGNAFLLLKPLMKEFGDRIINSILSEGATLGVCIGAALAGMRPIGEIQFNDFVATGFNQLVNNAAKIRYRWGGAVPMVRAHAVGRTAPRRSVSLAEHRGVVLPHAGTEDRRAVDAARRARADGQRRRRSRSGPLLRAHRALSRSESEAAARPTTPPQPIPIGKAALRRAGDDLAIISYGAYVHAGMRVAETLAKDGIESSVLDLRSLAPLDRDAVLAVARHCNRVLIIHEDTRTGSIGESLAAIIQEEAFEYLDAPIRILGALDTPVPYSPPLEEEFLASEAQIERAARC